MKNGVNLGHFFRESSWLFNQPCVTASLPVCQ